MFRVPTIPPDLRHEESVTQAAYALDCLQKIISSIFCQIDKRIERNNVKVNELQERIKKSQEKINSLRGSSKAIHIYAPARYPSVDVFKDLPVSFNVHLKNIFKESTELSTVYHIQSKPEANLPNATEKLIFFHVRDNTIQLGDTRVAKDLCNIQQNQNLGKMPSGLRSIPSVLLFNTDCTVYLTDECDSETDSWKRAKLFKNKRQQQGHNEQIVVKQILEPAPHSLANRHNEKLTPSGSLKYTPKLSEAPELDLPLDLPDLPGIADDLHYEGQEAKQKIAPSLALAVENLPELTELMKDNITIIENETDLETSLKAPLPPPPLPTQNKAVITKPPPPPPPPPAFQIQSSQTVTNQRNVAIPQKAPPVLDTRSELMAAIRNAGGVGKAHLRRTAAAPIAKNYDDVDNNRHGDTSVKNLNSVSLHSGDLMADLHNKLLMRRKGISGSKDANENSNTNFKDNIAITPSGNPVISRLSALIPPPPANTKFRTHNTTITSDDDGEDSNDTDWVD